MSSVFSPDRNPDDKKTYEEAENQSRGLQVCMHRGGASNRRSRREGNSRLMIDEREIS